MTKTESLNNRRNLAVSQSTVLINNNPQQANFLTIRPSMSLNDVPLSPNSIDERYRKYDSFCHYCSTLLPAIYSMLVCTLYMLCRIRAIQNTLATNCKSNSEKNLSQSCTSKNSPARERVGTGMRVKINAGNDSSRSSSSSTAADNFGKRGVMQHDGEEPDLFSSVSSPSGIANLNYSSSISYQHEKVRNGW